MEHGNPLITLIRGLIFRITIQGITRVLLLKVIVFLVMNTIRVIIRIAAKSNRGRIAILSFVTSRRIQIGKLPSQKIARISSITTVSSKSLSIIIEALKLFIEIRARLACHHYLDLLLF